ncbi:peptidase S41 [Enterococcus faecalis]|nr:peptidase S41 [Enterococcus faecalis]
MGTEIDYSTSVPIVIMGRFVMKIFKYLFTLGCLFFLGIYILHQSNQYLSLDTRSVDAVQIMSQSGIIENQKKWASTLSNYNYGKSVKNISELNKLLIRGNKHSSILNVSAESMESDLNTKENLPSSMEIEGLSVISVPGLYTTNNEFRNNYSNTLAKLIDSAKGDIVLDLANNSGGDVVPMIIGASSLIPTGKILNSIDKNGNKFPIYLESNKLFGGITNYLEDSSKQLKTQKYSFKKSKKVSVIISDRTASAAEVLTLVLKTNPNVTVLGTPSAGYTSWNETAVLPNKDNPSNFWYMIYTAGYFETIKNHEVFNNTKIIPDVEVRSAYLDIANNQLIEAIRRIK